MHPFPLHYMETAKALKACEGRIRMNVRYDGWMGEISLFSFVQNVISMEGRKKFFGKNKDASHIFLQDAIPGLIGQRGEDWSQTPLGRWVSEEMIDRPGVVKNRIMEELGWLSEAGDRRILAEAIRKAIWLYRTEDGKWECPMPIVTDEMCLVDANTRASVETRHWGTDGSESEGTAGFGLCVDGTGRLDISSKVDGKQTINRAEALAVLHALLVTKPPAHTQENETHFLHIYSDSQVTIDSMEKVYSGKYNRFRFYKDISNVSIFSAINMIRVRLREEHGIELVMHKVDAHKYDEVPIEEITDDWGGLLNKQADTLAKEGRRHGEVRLKQPYHRCARAVFESRTGIEESNVYSRVYEEVDGGVLRHMRSLKNASPRLRHYDMEGIWEAKAKNAQFSGSHSFAFHLFFRCLHTARNVQITNMHIPMIYPDCMCPLCGIREGNEFHTICACRCLDEAREGAFYQMSTRLEKHVGIKLSNVDQDFLSNVLFPRQVGQFKYGKVPITIKEYLLENKIIPAEKLFKLAPYFNNIIREMYYSVWQVYGEELGRRKKSFLERLKDEYDWDLKDLKKNNARLKAALYAEQREERARQREIRNMGLNLAEEERDEDVDVDMDEEDEVLNDEIQAMEHERVEDRTGIGDDQDNMDTD